MAIPATVVPVLRLLPFALAVGFFPARDGWTQQMARSPDTQAVKFSCDFRASWAECGFYEQSKSPNRASLVTVAGMPAVRLRTVPGDNQVAGSGTAERNDLTLSQATTDCSEGRVHWWAHSILFPDDFVVPYSVAGEWAWGTVFDFHQTGPTGQANFQIDAMPAPIGLRFRVSAGPVVSDGSPGSPTREWPIGPIVRNVWYHFVYHIRWSSGSDGFIKAWINGALRLEHSGPTLYKGMGCYLKLANYHTAFGQATSVIHARVIRGTGPEAVSLTPLQGVSLSADNAVR